MQMVIFTEFSQDTTCSITVLVGSWRVQRSAAARAKSRAALVSIKGLLTEFALFGIEGSKKKKLYMKVRGHVTRLL